LLTLFIYFNLIVTTSANKKMKFNRKELNSI
jgi:hypothetical protein